MEVRPLSPSKQPWVPRCPELRWFSHFRLRHPRNSGFPDALSRGGLTIFACDILATLGSKML
eukprot:5183134-Pyramimonas_sp.AAC.1